MSRRDKNDGGGGGGAPGWMTTFSDLMSLLLTFFILLFSMSNVDAKKFQDVTNSLRASFLGGGEYILEGTVSDSVITMDGVQDLPEANIDGILIPQEIYDMYEKVADYLMENQLETVVTYSMDSKGVYVNIKDSILFDTGSAALKDGGIDFLSQMEGLINDFDNDIVIEGHTDNVPINNVLYPTNWELSTARAVNVVRYLSEIEGIAPERLSARGYGEYSPIAPNDTVENRASNRRVNIFIVIDREGEE